VIATNQLRKLIQCIKMAEWLFLFRYNCFFF